MGRDTAYVPDLSPEDRLRYSHNKARPLTVLHAVRLQAVATLGVDHFYCDLCTFVHRCRYAFDRCSIDSCALQS